MKALAEILSGFSPRQRDLMARFIAKANPPPVLHRFRRVSPWAIKELSVPEVHVAAVDDMNDPFEYRAPLDIDLEKLKASMFLFSKQQKGMDDNAAKLEAHSIDQNAVALLRDGIEGLRRNSGLICCSADPQSSRMWAYYGDSHKGICIGYSTVFAPFCLAHQVSYRDPEGKIDLLETLKNDPTDLSELVSCRKGSEWSFEQEFRIPVGPFPSGHTRLLPIQPDCITEIRFGAMISPDFKAQVLAAVGNFPRRPRIIQMACDHETFRLTETDDRTT